MRRKNNRNKLIKAVIGILIITIAILSGNTEFNIEKLEEKVNSNIISYQLNDIPEYQGKIYITINNNIPNFDEADYTTQSFEKYSELDILGRCGVAYANICKETMPADGDERKSISSVQPTGWKQAKYDGQYLYNRCHLIGYQLSDEDDNELNLITGTRYFNVSGMLPFENQVANYIKENEKNHVLYRVTPIYKENNLLITRSTDGSIFSRR